MKEVLNNEKNLIMVIKYGAILSILIFFLITSILYLSENQNSFEVNSKQNVILVFFVITFLMIIISFYVSSLIAKIFKNYKTTINKEMKKTIEKEKLLIQQSKMAIMGEMIGNIAHQLKQPLSTISMSNGLVKIHTEDPLLVEKKDVKDSIKKIDESINYLAMTIDDFRSFFKPDKEKQYFNIKDIFFKTFRLTDSQFKNNNIEVVHNIDDIEYYGYQNELLQVLINILKNAKDELIKLNASNERVIFIEAKKTKEKITIKIKDNAGGIQEQNLKKIFDAYFTTKNDNEGTGIGLYMCRQIIEGMNGVLSVENSEFVYKEKNYKGAEFHIVFNYK